MSNNSGSPSWPDDCCGAAGEGWEKKLRKKLSKLYKTDFTWLSVEQAAALPQDGPAPQRNGDSTEALKARIKRLTQTTKEQVGAQHDTSELD